MGKNFNILTNWYILGLPCTLTAGPQGRSCQKVRTRNKALKNRYNFRGDEGLRDLVRTRRDNYEAKDRGGKC